MLVIEARRASQIRTPRPMCGTTGIFGISDAQPSASTPGHATSTGQLRPPELSHVTNPVELPVPTEYACRMNYRLANSESISGLNE
jgi:hypothetical protein